MGHVAWFQEMFILRRLDGCEPILAKGDSMYDSFKVSYKIRWDHDFPDKAGTLAYAREVLDRCIDRLEGRSPSAEERSLYLLVAAHEMMHTENLMGVRQSLGYEPAHEFASAELLAQDLDPSYQPRDIEVPGGTFTLGASRDQGFVLDNETWAHEVEVAPFQICSTAVSNAEFAEFLDAGGYQTRSLWNKDDWNWRRREGAEAPLYWKKIDDVWHERRFGSWAPLRPWHPVCHINLHEARAYCRFAGRRLPTEAEWEMAASWDPENGSKRLYPWGEELPSSATVHMDLPSGGTVDVRCKGAGDSAFGCRQMLGNVWEWTSSKLTPYPGFEQSAYENYSLPYFGKKPVLRGGAWSTDPLLIRNTWRNFFIKHRRNIFAGLRTCAE
jgi:iron(II)-dependent oxidoreductase